MEMDLGLDILKFNGRIAEPLVPVVVRALTNEDLILLTVERGEQKSIILKKLTSRHHALARALASGMKDWEAAAVTGYDASRISILKSDPSFKELVEFYKDSKDQEFKVVHAQMANLSKDVIESLHDDLDSGELSVGHKIEIAKLTLDRTGNGPATTSTHNHNHTVDVASRMTSARKRIEDRKFIDITPEKEDAA